MPPTELVTDVLEEARDVGCLSSLQRAGRDRNGDRAIGLCRRRLQQREAVHLILQHVQPIEVAVPAPVLATTVPVTSAIVEMGSTMAVAVPLMDVVPVPVGTLVTTPVACPSDVNTSV